MGSTFTEEEAEERGSRFGWGRLVSVAAVAVLIVGAVWALSPGDGVAPAADPVHPDVAVVESAVGAFNEGDLDLLWSYLEEPEDQYGWVLGPAQMVEAKVAANEVIVLDDCAPAPNEGWVNCELSATNDHVGSSGLTREGTYTVEIVDGRIVSAVFDTDSNAALTTYGNALLSWMAEAHPEVYAALPAYPGEAPGEHPASLSTSGVPIAEAMPTVLEYVDEFIAQSDEYPVRP